MSCSGNKNMDKERVTLNEQLPAPSDNLYEVIISAIKLDSLKQNNQKVRLLDSLSNNIQSMDFIKYNETLTEMGYKSELLKDLKKIKAYRLQASRLSDLEILSTDSIDFDKPYQDNKDIEPFLIIYTPLISIDETIAVISIDNICFGLCGEGWSLILTKENEKWKIIERIDRWIG
jgi:hypothetical protein